MGATWGSWAWYDYAKGAQKETKLRDLEKWQYLVARGITGALWGTRRDIVEGLANLESVETFGTFVDFINTRVEARTLRFPVERIRREDPEAIYLRGSTNHRPPLTIAFLNSLSSDAEDGSRIDEKSGAGVAGEKRKIAKYLGASQRVRVEWEARIARGDADLAIMWIKGHRGIPGNAAVDELAETGTALQYMDETITEPGLIQRAERDRAAERNSLGMNYRPLQRLGRGVTNVAGLLCNKGLKAWSYKIGEAPDPECRWCGEGDETLTHLMRSCRIWRKRWPGGEKDIITPEKTKDGDLLRELLDLLDESG
ncbi:hypothetical protein BDZ91DRAFT_799768 [Kalaharituber pfeilii]|nr:hypothetical protein BDZ91DRAFT_799768 [Kalaharituber pfeilii]